MKYLKLFEEYKLGELGDKVYYSKDKENDTSKFVSYGAYSELDTIEDSEGEYVLESIPINKIVFSNEKPIPNKRITKEGQLSIEDVEDVENMINDIDNLPHIITIENKSGTYEIVDGMHRLTAYNELGYDTIKSWVGKQRL